MCMLCCMYVVPCIDIPIFHVLKMSLILVLFYFHKMQHIQIENEREHYSRIVIARNVENVIMLKVVYACSCSSLCHKPFMLALLTVMTCVTMKMCAMSCTNSEYAWITFYGSIF